MRSFFYRFRRFLRRHFDRLIEGYAFRVDVRERYCRQEFFYNAFKALSFNGIRGDYLEFGCNGGMTFSLAYRESRRHGHACILWAFDSFQGLPAQKVEQDAHPKWVEHSLATELSRFHQLCVENGVPRQAYEVVPGFYDTSLPSLGRDEGPGDIACVYIDCDLYSSTRDVLEFLIPRLKNGMIIAFDDYHCYSANQLSGERRAALEFFSDEGRWLLLPFMRFGWHGEAFVVEDRQLHPKRKESRR